MPLRRAEIEEPFIERKSPILADLQNGTDQLVKISRFAIGSQPHNLVFTIVDFEPEVIGEYGVEQTKRMREMNCPLFSEAITFAQMYRSRLVLSDPVEGYDDCTFERRGEKRRRRMRPVMLRILDITLETHVVSDLGIDRKLVMHEAGYLPLENTTRTWPIIDDLVPKPVEL